MKYQNFAILAVVTLIYMTGIVAIGLLLGLKLQQKQLYQTG